MIPHELLERRMAEALDKIRAQGATTWGRVEDWQKAQMPRQWETGDDDEQRKDGMPEDVEDDRKEDAAAARYHDELTKLAKRLNADTLRLVSIMGVCSPRPPKDLATNELLMAQIASEGWCSSCWRLDQQLIVITTDPGGHRYYRDWCRSCGAYKADNGALPSLDMLRIRQRRKWNTADLAKANARQGRAS